MGEVVSSALRQIGAEVSNPKPREKAREVIVHVEPDWLKFLKENQDLLYFVGLFVLAILCLLVFGAVWVAIALPIVWFVFFNKAAWTVLIPIGFVLLIGVFL